jgi:hypothetical protein
MRLFQLVPPALVLAMLVVVPALGDDRSAWSDIARHAGERSSVASGTFDRAAAPGAGITGGCKSVATFTSSAVPELRKDNCIGCHGGGSAAATGALDLTNVDKDNAAACAQALRRVNPSNKPQSAIIQAAAGTQAHVGGKVANAPAFTSALLGWSNNE